MILCLISAKHKHMTDFFPIAENAKWLLNVQWQMEGVDLHLDVNIGKHLSALARTLTMLTGAPDITGPQGTYDSDDDVDHSDHTASQVGHM